MKKRTSLLFALPFALLACNNESKDSVETADSTNAANMDSTRNTVGTDEESTNFLVNAADGGLAEVQMGELAQQKATNPNVKNFAALMIKDHTAANDQVKALASQRNVALPPTPADNHKNHMDDLSKKTGKDFDKAYMNMMEDDHEKTINMFESASGKVNDAEVKAFIDNTIPKLKMHLDSVKAVQARLK